MLTHATKLRSTFLATSPISTLVRIMSESEGAKRRPHPSKGDGGGPKKKFFLLAQPQDGHTGLIVTSDRGREPRCAKEMIDLFDEVAELHFPMQASDAAPQQEEPDAPLSLEAELAKELTELKQSRRKKHHRFQVVESGCNNIVFIRFMDAIDPNKFVVKLFEHMVQEVKKPRTRYSNRILPIEKTSFVSEDSIVATITPMIERVFVTENESKRPFKFRVELKVRNNDKIDKDSLKRRLVSVVGKGHFVDLKTPHKLLLGEVFGKAAGVAVFDFEAMELYKSFNIRTVSAGFGLPLPPHPDESKKSKNPRASSSQPDTTQAPSSEDTQPESGSVQPTETEDSENPQLMDPRPSEDQTADESDSDSDNGGISLF